MAEDTTTATIDLGCRGGTHKRRSSILKPPRGPLDEVDQNFLTETTEKRRRSKRVSFSGTTDIKIYERDILQGADKSATCSGNVPPPNLCDGRLPGSEEADRANIAGLLTLPIKQSDLKSSADPEQLVESEPAAAAFLKGLSLPTNCHEDAMSLTMVTENLPGISTHKTRMLDENMSITLMPTTNVVSSVMARTILANEDIEETCLEKSFAYFGGNDDTDDGNKEKEPQVYPSPNNFRDPEQSTEVKPSALPFLRSLLLLQSEQQENAESPRIKQEERSLYKTTVQDVSMSITIVAPRADDTNTKQDEEAADDEDMEKTCFEKSFACFDVDIEGSDGASNEEKLTDVALKDATEDSCGIQVQASLLLPDSPTRDTSDNGISFDGISPIGLARPSQRQAVSVMEDQPSVLPCGRKDLRLHSTMIGEVEFTTNIRAGLCGVAEGVEEGCNVKNCLQETPAPASFRLSPLSDEANRISVVTDKSPATVDVEGAQCVIASEEKEKKCSNSVALQSCMDITDINGDNTLTRVGEDKTNHIMNSASRLINIDTLGECKDKCIEAETLQVEEKNELCIPEKTLLAQSQVLMKCTEMAEQSAGGERIDNSVCEGNVDDAMGKAQRTWEHSLSSMKVPCLDLEIEQKMSTISGTETSVDSSPILPLATAQNVEGSSPEHLETDTVHEDYKLGNSVAIHSTCDKMGKWGTTVSFKSKVSEGTSDISEGSGDHGTAVPSIVQLDPHQGVFNELCGSSPPFRDPDVHPGCAVFQTESVKTCFSDMHLTCMPKEATAGKCVISEVDADLEQTEVNKKCATIAESTFGSTMQYTCIQQHPEETENAIFPKPLMMLDGSKTQNITRDKSAVTSTSADLLNSRAACGVVQGAKEAATAPCKTIENILSASPTYHYVAQSVPGAVPTEDCKETFGALNRNTGAGLDLESKKEDCNVDMPATGSLAEFDVGNGRVERSTLMTQDSVLLSSTKKGLRGKKGAFFATSLLSTINRQYDGFGSVDAFKRRDYCHTAVQKPPSSSADVSKPVQRALFTPKHCVAASPFEFSPKKVASEVCSELKDATEIQSVSAEAVPITLAPPLSIAREEHEGCKKSPVPDTKIASSFSASGSDILHESMPSFYDNPLSVKKTSSSTIHVTDKNSASSTDVSSAKLQQYKSDAFSVPGAEDVAPAEPESAAAAQDDPTFAVAGASSTLPMTDSFYETNFTYCNRKFGGTVPSQEMSASSTVPGARYISPADALEKMTVSPDGKPETIFLPQRRTATFTVPGAKYTSPDDTLRESTVSQGGEPQMIVLPQRKSATFTVTCAANILSSYACTTEVMPPGSEAANAPFTVKGEESITPADTPAQQKKSSMLNTRKPGKPIAARVDKSPQSKICETAQPAMQDKPRTPNRTKLSQLKPTASVALSTAKQTKVGIVGTSGSAFKCTPTMTRSSSRLKPLAVPSQEKQPPFDENIATLTSELSAASIPEHSKQKSSSKRHVGSQQQTTSVTRSSTRQLQTLTTSEVKCSNFPATAVTTGGSTSKKAKLRPSKRARSTPSMLIPRATASTSKKSEMKASQTPSRVLLRSSWYIKKLQSAKTHLEEKSKNPVSEVEKGSLSPVHKVAKLSNTKKSIIQKEVDPPRAVCNTNVVLEKMEDVGTTKAKVLPSIPTAAGESVAMDVDTCGMGKSLAATVHLADSLLSGIAEMTEDSIDEAALDNFEDIDGELDLTVGTDELIKRLQEPTPENFLEQFFWGAYDISEDEREFVITEASRESAQFSFGNGKALLTVVLEDCGACSPGDKVRRGVRNIALVPTHSSTPISKFLYKMFMDGANPSSLPLLCKSNDDLFQTLKFLCRASYKCRCFGEDYISAISGNSFTFDADEMLSVEYMCDNKAWWFYVIFKLDHQTYPNAAIRPMVEIKWGPESIRQDIDKIVCQVRPGRMYLSRMVKEIAKSLHITTFDDWLGPLLGWR